MMDCVFCKIVDGKIQAKIIAQTSKSLAFMDAFPLTMGHTLVIPKNHSEKIQDLSIEDTKDLFETVHKVISKVDKITNATLMAVHNGKESGQEIPHVHVHLIPRTLSDGAGPVHSMFNQRPSVSDEKIQEIYEKLKIS